MTLGEAKQRIARLEELVGDAKTGDTRSLMEMINELREEVEVMQRRHSELLDDLDAKFGSQKFIQDELVVELTEKTRALEDELALIKRVLNTPRPLEESPAKIKVPEPKEFHGNRNARDLENFIWDLEQYFKAAKIPDREQVNIASMFLCADAKLWWRTRMVEDQSAGRPEIASWETMKKELKEQFLPCNTAWVARESLKKLKQTGSVRDYVKEFSSLMLDIPNMGEEDKLFNFMSGLQTWAQAELRRQGVRDIPSAMAAAEGLIDFRVVPTVTHGEKKKAIPQKTSSWRDGRRKPGAKKDTTAKDDKPRQFKSSGCFLCEGPHKAKDCPKKQGKVNAMASRASDQQEGAETGPSRVNPLQLLNSISAKKTPPCRELMYVTIRLNGRELKAMVDTGATNNFVAQGEAATLGLSVSKSTSMIKAVNSEAVHIHGLTEATLEVGSWKGVSSFMVIPLDDFKVILGLEFFVSAKVTLMPYLRGIMIGDERSPCFVPTTSVKPEAKKEMPTLSAKQVEKGIKKGCATFVAALVRVEPPMAEGVQTQEAEARAHGEAEQRSVLAQGQAAPRRTRRRRRNRHARPALAQGQAGPRGPGADERLALAPCQAMPRDTQAGGPVADAARSALAASQAGPSRVGTHAQDGEAGHGAQMASPLKIWADLPDEVGAVLREFMDVMPDELPKELPPRREVDHHIDLEPGARPPAKAPYRMSPSELAELRKQLDDLLDAGLLQPSKAPYGAPVLFQKKKDGSMRMCVDYRALNKITIKNKYPVPNAADLFDRLAKASFFTKLDLRSGYWQVRIAPGDEAKMTCVTRYGSYEFLVMPFGLTNAPATFCNLMTNVLYEFLDRFVVVYLDDIVVYSQTLDDHVNHLRLVFAKLREYKLYVKREKCCFCSQEIPFLGHWIGNGKVRMDEGKIRAIVDWPMPTKVFDLRSFLGLANYYRRFIEGYSRIASPLTDMLKKDHQWVWSEACQAAFDKLKLAISSEPVLKLPDFDHPFEMHTDASDKALGGVLVQEGHPVAFESRKLNEAEQRYSAHEKEMTAVIHCLDTWRHYLLGTRFTIVTDNVANTYFKTQKNLTPKQARWQEFLAEFDFAWVHRPGRQNQVADALSRKEVQEYVGAISTLQASFLERIRGAASGDKSYVKLKQEVAEGLTRRFWIEGELLYAKGSRLYVPHDTGLKQDLLRETHDARWAGHPGVERMHALLSRSYYWPKMHEDVETYVKTCRVCQMDKVEHSKQAGLLQPLPIPERPWASISMDFIVGLPEVKGMRTVFVVVDRFSKYAVFIGAPLTCSGEEAAMLFFTNVVKWFGVPVDIVSDRDGRFTGQFWTSLFKLLGSKLKFSTTNHPQMDGQTERINALLEDYLRHYVSNLKPFHDDSEMPREQPLRAPPTVTREFTREVEAVLARRQTGSGKNLRTEFLIQWKGDDVSEAAWEKAEALWQFEEQIQDYLRRSGSTRASTSSSGGGLSHHARRA